MAEVVALLQAVLYLISSLLFVPVLLLLVLLFFWSLYLAGAVLGEFFRRRRGTKRLVESFSRDLEALVVSGCDDVEVERLIRFYEEREAFAVDRLRMLIRVGPSLGLMGTLIPMGVGLAALSKGQIEKLTSSMIIAFTTTVVGLAVAVVAYVLATFKQKWLSEDMALVEYMAERALRDGKVYEKKKEA